MRKAFFESPPKRRQRAGREERCAGDAMCAGGSVNGEVISSGLYSLLLLFHCLSHYNMYMCVVECVV